jgi:transposase InsO family protein
MMKSLEPPELLRGIGRDKFEEILMRNGLRVRPIRVFHRTTYSGSFRFPNRTEGLEVRRINHVWVSDLTYYRLYDDWAYLTFILDLYSKRCIGYAVSQNMTTEATTLAALKMALKNRKITPGEEPLLFHSDGGGQYLDQDFLSLLKQHRVVSSMAEDVYENPHAERFHGTAKNDYLIPWGVNSLRQLRKELHRFVYLYNHLRPHQSLKDKPPAVFEEFVQHIPLSQRPMVLFKKVT